MHWGWMAVSLAVALGVATSASAVTPEDRAAADQLFKDGRALIKIGAYAEACPKLASSNALDPTPGTMLALGDCYELNGQTASAWATFSDAEAAARGAGDKKRQAEAQKRRDAVEPRLSKILIEIPVQAPGLQASRNGKPIQGAMLGTPFPVDPGKHAIDVTAPNKQPWHIDLTIAPAPGITKVPVPPLADGPGGGPVGPVGPQPPPKRDTSKGNGQRIAGVVVGSVGLAGIIVGSIFGGLSIATVGDIEDRGLCDDTDPVRCSQEGLDLQDEANTQANVSNVALAVGGAAVITGVIVFFTAPRVKPGPPPTAITVVPSFDQRGGSLTLLGSF